MQIVLEFNNKYTGLLVYHINLHVKAIIKYIHITGNQKCDHDICLCVYTVDAGPLEEVGVQLLFFHSSPDSSRLLSSTLKTRRLASKMILMFHHIESTQILLRMTGIFVKSTWNQKRILFTFFMHISCLIVNLLVHVRQKIKVHPTFPH